ncbi:N-acetyltransferase [Acinetobacter sp. WCHA55]|uniref:GNAT family N-acetyltransferase n=1 Tax=Acinetobacter sp. WCHA55 TaxID=2004646 RepID=UPI000B3CD8B1|nr:GNAT family N-acetyltransferase [Acinetobacter sp. WCHA55]AYA68178.1 N-acetyltransferase [Acinetobacter sp. WCHA55]
MSAQLNFVIETARLRLRAWHTDDFPAFAQLNADAQVMRYFPSPLTQTQSDALAQTFQQFINQNGWGFWAVELKHSQEFIGFTGLHAQPEGLDFLPCVEIGWRLDSKFWHQGYATEAAQACLYFAFSVLDLDQVVAFTAVQNRASEAVMKRLGMQHGGYFNHPKLDQNSPLLRHTLYVIKPTDFLKNLDEYGLNQSIHIVQD